MAAHFLQKSRHKSVFYFRRRVPDDLQQLTGCRQMFRSLHTTDRREAIVRARVLAVETDHRFRDLRTMAKNRGGARTGYTMSFKKGDFEFTATGEPHEGKAMDISMKNAHAIATAADAKSPSSSGEPSASTAVDRGAASAQPNGPTLADALAAYRKSANVKPTTARRYAPFLKALEAAFGSATPLSAITQSRFAEYAASTNAGARAPKTKGLHIGTNNSGVAAVRTFMGYRFEP